MGRMAGTRDWDWDWDQDWDRANRVAPLWLCFFLSFFAS
jgi:hypothetical protein